jgi:uncharacterized protein YciI
MYFVVTRHDKPGRFELRMASRPPHLVYLEGVLDKIVYGGALLDDEGKQNGSILIIDVPDMKAAEAFAQADPFNNVDLFAETSIKPFRPVFRDGGWIR